ncbi:MAG: metallophosphoesterase, partial [Anaerolineaceae bacterium]
MAFSFAQITDHHIGRSAEDAPHNYPTTQTLRAVLDDISAAGQGLDFLLSTGDLVNTPDEASYRYFLQLINAQPAQRIPGPHRMHYGILRDFPIYLMPGNHDDRDQFFRSLYHNEEPARMNQALPSAALPSAALPSAARQNAARMNAVFTHKGVRFVMIDWGPGVQAELTDEMLGFLKQALDTHLPAVLMMHHNVVRLHAPLLDGFLAENVEPFYAALRANNILAVLCGHLHTTYEKQLEGIPVLGLRSTA